VEAEDLTVPPRALPFVLAMCAAEVLGMLSFASFQALIPTFVGAWHLSNTEAGWISGVYFAGYVAAVPVLTSVTDRIDPRRVLAGSLLLGGAASIGFALWADGFWTALVFRALHGVGLAGTYMPGLKALSDRIDGPRQSRYVSFYTSSFGIGASISFVLTGGVADALGWRWAFAVSAIGSVLAIALTFAVLPARTPAARPVTRLLDFRPVLGNRAALGYILGYFGHNWELFAFRAWAVAFLVHAGAASGHALVMAPTAIAAAATLLGVPSSIFGNELALRAGRHRLIARVALASVAVSLVIGASAALSAGLAIGLCLLYGVLLTGDSAALTAGTVAAAVPRLRGATLALHAFIGFLGGAVGPLAVGAVLDATPGAPALGWWLGFVTMGAGSAFALAAVLLLAREPGGTA
jgi:predicted MFS family arabinose efflux permease